MEIVILALVLAAVGVALAWDQVTQRSHVGQVRTHWDGRGRAVQVGPIGTIGHADRLSTRPGERVFGALGVVDGQLVFSGATAPACWTSPCR